MHPSSNNTMKLLERMRKGEAPRGIYVADEAGRRAAYQRHTAAKRRRVTRKSTLTEAGGTVLLEHVEVEVDGGGGDRMQTDPQESLDQAVTAARSFAEARNEAPSLGDGSATAAAAADLVWNEAQYDAACFADMYDEQDLCDAFQFG